MTAAPDVDTGRASALGPLRIAIFRALWLAALVSNIGSWMQTVGAQWLLVDERASPAVIALVQTASSAPVLLLGIPAGVLAEFVNRRRLLIGVQAFQVVIGVLLTVLTALGEMTPALLLVMTFLIGAASAIQLPAYQALVPEIVPRSMIRDAAGLSSIGVNIARAIGPAVAGLIIAHVGVPFVFAVNAATFLAFLLVLVTWRGYRPTPPRPEPFVDATRAGIRYIRNSPVMMQILRQLALFMIPANALWALLPVVASDHLGLQASGYGLLLAALGVGSVGGAFLIPPVRSVVTGSTIVLVASVVFGGAMIALVLVTSLWIVIPLLVVAGIAWIGVVITLNGAAQTFLPAWVRARGLSVYQLVLFGSTAAGAAFWGAVAAMVTASTTMWIAGGITVVTACGLLIRPLMSTDADRTPTKLPFGDLPAALEAPAPDTGDRSVAVFVEYTVPPEHQAEFDTLMPQLRRSRLRTGAAKWSLYEDPQRPGAFTEMFTVNSWREHVSQHEGRQTGYDESLIERARALSTDGVAVRHLLKASVSKTHAGGTAHS